VVSSVRKNSLNGGLQYEIRESVCFKLYCTVKTKKEDFSDSLISTVQDKTLRMRKGRFTHSMPCPCRAHTVPLPCRAAKVLECIFPI